MLVIYWHFKDIWHTYFSSAVAIHLLTDIATQKTHIKSNICKWILRRRDVTERAWSNWLSVLLSCLQGWCKPPSQTFAGSQQAEGIPRVACKHGESECLGYTLVWGGGVEGSHVSPLGPPSASLRSPLTEPSHSRKWMAVVKRPLLPTCLGWLQSGWVEEVLETERSRMSKKISRE